MKHLALAGFLATVGIAAIPASSLAQNVDAGCPRGYYHTVDGCIPNSQGIIGPEYGNAADTSPRYYREAPTYSEAPRYHRAERHYYVIPDGE